MSYQATVLNVMIASPGDVARERQIIRETIYNWNAVNSSDRSQVLLPVGWETHAYPQFGDRPQEIINKQILEDSDILVAVFWTRLGMPTGEAISGTVEEIEKHLAAGKPALIYFSSAPVVPDSIDQDQYQALIEFKRELKEKGLIQEYANVAEFSALFARQLQQTVIKHFGNDKIADDSDPVSEQSTPKSTTSLSKEAETLLIEATQDRSGIIMCIRYIGGTEIQTNGKGLATPDDPKSVAIWEGAIEELQYQGLVKPEGHKGQIFKVTREGYQVADMISRGK